jgi:hypothetical protein
MTDSYTKEPLRVRVDPVAGILTLWVREEQLDAVQKLLKAHAIRYWVEDQFYSVDDEPAWTVIHLYRSNDPRAVQEILDRAD